MSPKLPVVKAREVIRIADLKPKTLTGIIEDMGLTVEQFRKLL